MQHVIKITLSALTLWLPVFGQSLTIPHVVDGGGWQSTIVLTNTTDTLASASLVFHKETTGGSTQAWTPPFVETVSTSSLTLTGGSVLILHTTGKASDALSQGWAELNAPAGVIGYVVFTIRAPGRQDQDGTAPAVAASARILVPYDDANGFVTGIAITNPTGSAQDLSVGFRTTSGGVAVNALPSIPAGGHRSFVLSQQFPVINGHAGLAEFYSTTGTFSLVALRFNPTSSFTAAPAYSQSGAPLIKASTDPYNPSDPYNPYDPYGGIPGYMYPSIGSGGGR